MNEKEKLNFFFFDDFRDCFEEWMFFENSKTKTKKSKNETKRKKGTNRYHENIKIIKTKKFNKMSKRKAITLCKDVLTTKRNKSLLL